MKKFILIVAIGVHLIQGCVKESNFTSSIEIDAPAFLIFELVSNPENLATTMPGLLFTIDEMDVSQLMDSENQKSAWQITEFEKNQKLKFRHMDGSSLETTITLTPVAKNKTIYTVQTSVIDFNYENEVFQNIEKDIVNFKSYSEEKFNYFNKLKTAMNQ